MTHLSLDNSIREELKRAITWQYDHAENLIGFINTLKGFFDGSTKEFWDAMPEKLNLRKTVVDPFALAIWGRILKTGRPVVCYQDTEGAIWNVPVTDDLYRRILVGRFRLLQGNASMDDYKRFADYVFDGNATASDGLDMSMAFSWVGDAPDTPSTDEEAKDDETWQMYMLVTQKPDAAVVYPAGVLSHDQSDGPVFGFEEQAKSGTAIRPRYTSVLVDYEVKEGQVLDGDMQFVMDGITYSCELTTAEYSSGKHVVRFKAEGSSYVPKGAVYHKEFDGIDTIPDTADGVLHYADGSQISSRVITGVRNSRRSSTDFRVETMDNCVFAWNRKFD